LHSLPPSPTPSIADRQLGAWTILAAVGIVPVAIGGAALGFLLIALLHGGIDARHISLATLLTAQLFGYVFVAAYVLFLITALWRRSLADVGFRTPSLVQIGTALAGAAAMIVVVTSLAQLVAAIAHVHHEQQAVQMFRAIRDPRLAIYFALVVTLAAPIVEELTFRVFIFNAARMAARFWAAALLSGALFALAHADPYLLVPLTAGGVILCYVYVRTGNAWMSMITHACFNGFTLAVLFIAPRNTF
jgi:membrane protease YdiL (CAAX protease family)